jgi:ppGpp synthetase/RelA/SpoT-type nucleotidyltranferase
MSSAENTKAVVAKAEEVGIRLSSFLQYLLGKELNADATEHFGLAMKVDYRVKSQDSIDRNNRKYNHGKEENYRCIDRDDKLSHATRQVQDLIGVRIVVQTQRQKLRVVRAINTLINTDVKLPGHDGLKLASIPGERWTSAYTELEEARGKNQKDEIKRELIDKDLIKLSDQELTEFEKDASKHKQDYDSVLETVENLEWVFEESPDGYPSIQRKLIAKGNWTDKEYGSFVFELQVRTMLEHVWAVAAHDMTYKGTASQRTDASFRRLRSQLASADDLVQHIYESYQEDSKSTYRVPFSPFIRLFGLGKYCEGFTDLPHLGKDLEHAVESRRYGRPSTALRIIRKLRKAVEGSTRSEEDVDAARASLQLEEAAMQLHLPDSPSQLSDAFTTYDDLWSKYTSGEGKDFCHAKVIAFWAAYRKSFVIARSLEYVPDKRYSPPLIGDIEVAKKCFKDARNLYENEITNDGVHAAYDATELDADMALWEAILHGKEHNFQDAFNALTNIRDETFGLRRDTIKDQLPTGLDLTAYTRRKVSTSKRVCNARMYYLIRQGKHAEALMEYDKWLQFLAQIRDNAHASERQRLDTLTGENEPAEKNSWDCYRLKRYDTLVQLFHLLDTNDQSFTVGPDTIFPRGELADRATRLENRIKRRLEGLAIRGDVMFEKSFLTKYGLLPRD